MEGQIIEVLLYTVYDVRYRIVDNFRGVKHSFIWKKYTAFIRSVSHVYVKISFRGDQLDHNNNEFLPHKNYTLYGM